MPFNRDEACKLLAACHRRCCICHRFSGIKMELDHIIPSAEGGSDHSENAIPVCFECHAEIHLYNDQHPRGHKFRPAELRLHKEQRCQTYYDIIDFDAHGYYTSDVHPIATRILNLFVGIGRFVLRE